ncbi:MAG: ATP-binding protein DrrA1-3 family domain-containing protein, partial [Actinomycetaceae bacterium]
SILFLDEPTTGLDPRSRADLWDVVRELRAEGTTILLTTQYLEEADQLADRIAVIDGGRIVADDTAAALKQRVGTDRLRLVLDPADLDPAAALLGPDAVVREDTVEVPLADPDHLRRVLDALHGAGLEVRSTELDRPTLDDVFLTLTGACA